MSRETRIKARREAGKSYKYKKNPYTEGSEEYIKEQNVRATKNINHRLPTARWTSIMRKVDNDLMKAAAEDSKRKREAKEKKIKKETVTM